MPWLWYQDHPPSTSLMPNNPLTPITPCCQHWIIKEGMLHAPVCHNTASSITYYPGTHSSLPERKIAAAIVKVIWVMSWLAIASLKMPHLHSLPPQWHPSPPDTNVIHPTPPILLPSRLSLSDANTFASMSSNHATYTSDSAMYAFLKTSLLPLPISHAYTYSTPFAPVNTSLDSATYTSSDSSAFTSSESNIYISSMVHPTILPPTLPPSTAHPTPSPMPHPMLHPMLPLYM